MKKVITFGSFDLLHEGHIKMLERARSKGDYLIVGVSTDELISFKGKIPVFPQEQRLSYISALSCVDEVFYEAKFEDKDKYIKERRADLLVMGDDLLDQFNWVSCDVEYLSKTEIVSPIRIKTDVSKKYKVKRILFGDTYIRKHYDCALSIVNEMTEANIAPIFTTTRQLPLGVECDSIVYFNKPAVQPQDEYKDVPKVLIDHGASTLKWFLASKERFNFFDKIITAGQDHVNALLAFFGNSELVLSKVKSAGFIKSNELLSPARYSRDEISKICGLNPNKPIILFAPTWHIYSNRDMNDAIKVISTIDNEVTSLHPETTHLNTDELNTVDNINGMTLELLKHADCVISDTSSTLFEAAALKIPTIQIQLAEYSDNNANMYDFPHIAGTADLFYGGILSKPQDIKSTVDKLIHNNSDFLRVLSVIQDRIIKGTEISNKAGNNIVNELICSCDSKASKNTICFDLNLTAVHENMFFSSNKIIAHGGGNYKKHHASNSLEAIKASIDAVNIVEIDIVKSLDGIIVAHDGFENRFGLGDKFDQISTNDFLKLKYQGKLTAISIEDALRLCTKAGKAVVCDIKATGDEYTEIMTQLYEISKSLNIVSRVIIQCYRFEDYEAFNRIGFKRSILAVWKYYYKDPLGKKSLSFIEQCMSINASSIVGISIPHINKHMAVTSYQDGRIHLFQAFWKRVYIHGAPMKDYPEILRANLGLFADAFSEEYDFESYVRHFSWIPYLYLNPDLIKAGIDNQVSAICHYLKYGRNEGRLFKYDLPSNFDWGLYLQLNHSLRAKGIGSPGSAMAHWTKYGKIENRKYY
ncbi:adenylyltransferase/cytidyltransferase family protein [Microbulbifer sp. 2304DJ12-6]|uniref:adenylyltransferase/cytidyltransferase family protein n=1 Tax=Microbulbifer sp. 2304DJ12-6 TaxID=3233340 RepID=UPI0039B0CC5D